MPRVLLRTCRPRKCRKITEDVLPLVPLCPHLSRALISGRQPGTTFQPLPMPQGAQSPNAAAALTSVHIRVPATCSALAAACPGEERYFGIETFLPCAWAAACVCGTRRSPAGLVGTCHLQRRRRTVLNDSDYS